MIPNGKSVIDWAVAQRAIPGQGVSGDMYLVQPYPGGILLAVVDGIGHGPEATRAAEIAVEILRSHPQEMLHGLIQRCHEKLKNTRGVVMTIGSLNTETETMTWMGVGNVEGVLVRSDMAANPSREHVFLCGGLIGAHLPSLCVSIAPVRRGDLLVMASDGIRADFESDLIKGAPRSIADHILNNHFKGTDDALVLVARYLGKTHIHANIASGLGSFTSIAIGALGRG